MEQIAEARLLVDDLEFADGFFGECLGYERGNNRKMLITYKMPSGSRLLIYDDNEVFRTGTGKVSIMLGKEKFEKAKEYLKGQKTASGDNTLTWLLPNGSMVDLETI